MGRRAKLEEGICAVCKQPFVIDHSNRGQKHCGPKCGQIACWARRKGLTVEEYLATRKAEKLSPSKAARKEALRPLKNPDACQRRCLCCDREFPSAGKYNRICPTCRDSQEPSPRDRPYKSEWHTTGRQRD